MSNFWFNEDAFQSAPTEGPDNDITSTLFDDFTRGPQETPTSYEQTKHEISQQLATPMQPPKEDSLFENDEFRSMGTSNQPVPSFDPENASMFAGQPDTLNQAGIMNQNSSKMDQMQQKDQLYRMRQQLMHQQMLHRQQQSQHTGDGVQVPVQRPQDEVGGENYASHNQVNATGPDLFNNIPRGSMAGESPHTQGQFGSRQNSATSMQNPYNQSSRGTSDNAKGPPVQSQTGVGSKPSPAQIAQLQHELFQMTLSDFMSRRGTPITQYPVINNKKINLLALQVLGRKIGGMQAVLKNLQMLNQPSNKITEWSSICHKLGLFEGFDFQSNIKAKQQIEKQLGSCYLQYILPYEQYTSTDDGKKDIQGRRLQFQRQLLVRLQQQQIQKPQTASSTPQSQSAQTPMSASAQGMLSDFQSRNTENQNLGDPTRKFSTSETTKSPHNMKQNAPKPLANVSTPVSSISKGESHSASPKVTQGSHSISSPVPNKQASQSQQKTPKLSGRDSPEPQENQTPNTIRKYVPIKKQSDSHGKMVLKGISELGDEIDLTKPVYLFAPELGSLNIHALIMSLKGYTPNNPGEVSSALNTLLVTTTDASFQFNLTDAPELLNALVELGSKILDQIMQQRSDKSDYNTDFSDRPTVIDDIFQRYVGNDTMAGEDVTYIVDSLTGEVIEDEDTDMGIDEAFSPEAVGTEKLPETEKGSEVTRCQLPDFMSSLRNFRDENKYHFSKVQSKGAVDDTVFLVDSLITTTMTLRNLSFTNESSNFMSHSPLFKDLIFKIVKSVATNPKAFTFERKRLCLLKDCLLMLDKNANSMELDTLEEAFLAFLLLSSFGPSSADEKESGKKEAIPSCSLSTYSYLSFAVDCYVKLLVREPKNKALFQALLSGSINNQAFSHVNGITESITDHDANTTSKLVDLYLDSDREAREEGILYTRSFKLFMSVVPMTMSGVEFTSFILQRSSTVLQALFGAKLLIDSISLSAEDVNAPLFRLPFTWLMGNIRQLLFNLAKNTISSITESVKFSRQQAEHKILSYVGFKSLVVINSLLANALILKTAIQEQELEDSAGMEEKFLELVDLYRVQPESDFVLNTLLASSIDSDVAQEIVRFHELLQKLG